MSNTRLAVHQHQLEAMGSQVEILLVGQAGQAHERAFRRARELAHEWEATFSRFRPTSELSGLNAQAGQSVHVSQRLYLALEQALTAARATNGLFDPTLLHALIALGYDRTFDEINPRASSTCSERRDPHYAEIRLDPEKRSVTLPAGVGIDLGGIAKGQYADELAEELRSWPGGVISAGGDMRVWGVPPDDTQWRIGVEDPNHLGRDLAELRLSVGGVATSATNRRNWNQGSFRRHHLLDPRTGLPATNGICSVTAVARTTTAAEVAAKALLIGGEAVWNPQRSLFSLAIVVHDNGDIVELSGTMEILDYDHTPAAAHG